LTLHVRLTVALEIPENTPTDYVQFTKNAKFKGLRLGVPREVFFDVSLVGEQEIIHAVNSAISKMASLGAVIQDPADLPSAAELHASTTELTVLSSSNLVYLTLETEFKIDLQTYLEGLNSSQIRTLEDLINFNDAHAELEFAPGECCQQVRILTKLELM
jgi:amidase